jgi:alpha-1,2-mannosyltransferase
MEHAVRPAGPGPGAEVPRPRLTRTQIALLAVNLAAVSFFLCSFGRHGLGLPYRIDLDVYRIGGQVWLRGGSLYSHLPATRAGLRLPFTYPPIAAVLLVPLALLPMAAAGAVLTLITIAALAGVLRLVLVRLAGSHAGTVRTLGWLLPAALFLEPVRSTLAFGQVNVLLMALVVADCLAASPRWPRGALVGLAAAVKLTPAAFVLFFLLRRDYRAAGTAGLSFGLATAAGFALDWRDSVRYWTEVVFQASRVGHLCYAANQSLLGVLARAGLSPQSAAGTAAWIALSAVAVALAAWGMRRALAARQDVLALGLNALAALLISPISWSHHWVWCAPLLVTLAVTGTRQRAPQALTAAACGLLVFASSPQWWFPRGANRELRWGPWEQVLGSSYVVFAVAVLALAAAGLLARPGAAPEDAAPDRGLDGGFPVTGRLAATRPPGQ